MIGVPMPRIPDIKTDAVFKVNGKEATLSFVLNSGLLGFSFEDLSASKKKPKDKKKKKT